MGLSKKTLFAYSAVSFGIYSCDLLNNLMLQTFLLDYASISPTYAGALSTISQIVEIIASTFIGKFSDKTHTSFGKRGPWILGGGIMTSGAIICMFINVPISWGDSVRMAYYVLIIVWYSFTFPATTIPLEALSAEITSDYDQRLELGTWAMVMSFAGQLLMVIFLFLLFNLNLDSILGFNNCWIVLAAFPGISTFLLSFITFFFVPNTNKGGTDMPSKIEANTLLKSLRLFTLPSFLNVVVIYSLVGQISSISLSLMPLFITHTIGEQLNTFSQVAIVMMGCTVITIYLLNLIGKNYEKKTIFNFGCILGIIAYLGFFFVPGSDETTHTWTWYWIFPLAGLSGVSSAITFTLPGNMMADVTDEAFYRFHSKQEGFMFSIMETIQSVIQAVGGILIGLRLDAVGYAETGEQSERVKLELRYLFCTIPLGVYLVVWFLGAIYPINRAKHIEILEKIRSLNNIEVEDTGYFAGSRSAGMSKINHLDSNKTLTLKKSQFALIQQKQTEMTIEGDGESNLDILEEKQTPPLGESAGEINIYVH